MAVKITSFLYQYRLYTSTMQFYNFAHNPQRSIYNILQQFKDELGQPQVEEKTWKNIRGHLQNLVMDSSFIDPMLLHVLNKSDFINAGKSYYQFLVRNNYNLSPVVHTCFLKLCERGTLEEENKEHVLKLYEYFTSKYMVLGKDIASTLVINLCKVNEAKKAVEIFEKYEKIDKNSLCSACDALISYFYDSGKPDEGYYYLLKSMKNSKGPSTNAYNSYLKYHLKNKHTVKEKIKELFSLWRQYNILPYYKAVLESLIPICNELGWCAQISTINKSKCSVCNQELIQILSDEDYVRLSKTIEQKLLQCSIYGKEVQSFIKFVNKNKPYGVVLDGLNILHNNISGFDYIKNIVDAQQKAGRKVLLIGRKHLLHSMRKYNLTHMSYYFVNNLSQDDMFVLYAAAASGRNCKIISGDLMRKQKFVIQDREMSALFRRWQISEQFSYGCNRLENLMEVSNLAIAQNHLNYWHIPCVSFDKENRKWTTHWTCIEVCP